MKKYPDPVPSDFIRASGRFLMRDGGGIRLVGINFPAYGWGQSTASLQSILAENNFRVQDYHTVASLGMNVVRLNLSSNIFENPRQPFSYQDQGWDWLNQQIEGARAAKIYLILDMHAPQGGYQAPGYDGDFWENPEPREQLQALWVEIARRYRNEIQIAAFDLINEPFPRGHHPLWREYAQQLVNAIRAVDENHLIIIEQDIETGMPFLLNDDSLMYDFHFYEPWRYAAQFYRYGYQGKYPNAQTPILPWEWDEGENCGATFQVAHKQIVGLMPLARTLESISEFEVFETEAGSTSSLMRIKMEVDSAPKPVSAPVSDNPFAVSPSHWAVFSPTHFKCEKLAFPVKQGCEYSITGGMEFLALNYKEGESSAPFTRDTIEERLLGEHGLQFYLDANVPVNIGEFGLSPHAFGAGRGGEIWVKDALEIFEKYNLNSQYWVYSGAADFALFCNRGEYPTEKHVNQTLAGLFQEVISEK